MPDSLHGSDKARLQTCNGPVSRVVVINDFSVARGGATMLVLLLLKLLREQNVDVTLIVGDDTHNADFDTLGIDVVRLGQQPLLKGNPLRTAINGINNTSAVNLISDWIAANDTTGTVYHGHLWSQILSPGIFVPLAKVAERTIIHAHDSFHACPNGAYMDYPAEKQCTRVPLSGSCLVTQCDRRSYSQKLWRVARQMRLFSAMGNTVPWGRLVTIHEKMANGFLRAGYAKDLLQTIRNPVRPFSETRIPVEHNKSIFYIGRLEQEKGAQDALEAAERTGVLMEIIGDGPMRAELEARYPKAIFHGWRDRNDIVSLIRQARGLVIPSRLPEPFGLVIAEAAASGIPVILTEMAFLADEIRQLGIGLSCNTQDMGELGNALTTMAEMPSQDIMSMSERAFASGSKLANSEQEWLAQLQLLYAHLVETAARKAA